MNEKLQYIIDSVFNSQGFDNLGKAVGKAKKESKGFSGLLNSSLGRMATGYLTITGLTSQYNKMVEASNYQLEQETKLYATMQGQGFRNEQIDSIKEYASALQEVGVVGDEVTLAGVQQLATYNLTEESLKRLMPAMQDMLVQQKGLNGTGGDAIGVANTLAKGLLGQTGRLEQVGISLNDYQRQLIATGTEEEKVGALVEAVTMNVGEQNKEFLKLPEGKIVSAQNRIGDMYEYWGSLMRETRGEVWQFLADNSDGISGFITGAIKMGTRFADTTLGVFKTIGKAFDSLDDGTKKFLTLAGAGFIGLQFPILGVALAIEDVIGAFQGKETFTEAGINALLKFTGTDYRFKELRQDVDDFWASVIDPAYEAEESISQVNFTLQTTLDFLKSGIDLLQIGAGIIGLIPASINFASDLATEGFETANDNLNDSFGWKNVTAGASNFMGRANHMSENHGKLINHIDKQNERKYEESIKKHGSLGAMATENIRGKSMNKVNTSVVNNFTITGVENGKQVAQEASKMVMEALEERDRNISLEIGGAYEY